MNRITLALVFLLSTTSAFAQDRLKVEGTGLSITSSYKFYVYDSKQAIAAINADGTVTFFVPETDAARKLLVLFHTSTKREWELLSALEGALLYVDYARRTNRILWEGKTDLPPDTRRFRRQIEADFVKWTALARKD